MPLLSAYCNIPILQGILVLARLSPTGVITNAVILPKETLLVEAIKVILWKKAWEYGIIVIGSLLSKPGFGE